MTSKTIEAISILAIIILAGIVVIQSTTSSRLYMYVSATINLIDNISWNNHAADSVSVHGSNVNVMY